MKMPKLEGNLAIPRIPKNFDRTIKEKYPHSTKAERQAMWEEVIKKLYVHFWEHLDRSMERKKVLKRAFPLKPRGFF